MRTGAGKADAICTLSNRTDDFFSIGTEEAEFVITFIRRTLNTVALKVASINFVIMIDIGYVALVQDDFFTQTGNVALTRSFLEIDGVAQYALILSVKCSTGISRFTGCG